VAVKKYYKTFEGQVIEAIQDAEEMSPAEESALRNAIGGDFTAVESNTVQAPKDDISKEAPKQSVFTNTGKFRGADYKSGVTNNFFRLRFSNTNNFKERINFLDKNVGKEGYVVDKLGNFLLTPKGQKEIGMETTNNLMSIDEDGLRGEDIVDLIGEVGLPALGSVGSFEAARKILPKVAPALMRGPLGATVSFLGPVAASGLGAFLSTYLDEAQQYARGISEQSFKDVTGRAKTEGAYALAGDFIFGGTGRLVGRYLKGSSAKQLEAFYGKGASKKGSEAYKKVFAEFDKTGVLIPQEGSLLFDIGQGITPDIYGKAGLDFNLRHRLALMAENIAGLRGTKLSNNVKKFEQLMRESLGTTEEGLEILAKENANELILEAIDKSINTTTKEFQNAANTFSTEIKDNLKGALAGLLKVAQRGTDGGPQTMKEVAESYSHIQDGVSIATRQATEIGQRVSKNGFRQLESFFKKVKPDNAVELTEDQIRTINNLTTDSLKRRQTTKFLEENAQSAAERGAVDNVSEETLKAIDEEIVRLGNSDVPEDIVALENLRGIRDEASVNIITDANNIPVFAFKNSAEGPKYVRTQETLKSLKKVLEQQPKLFDSIEDGILKKLGDSVKPGYNGLDINYLSPNEHNELVTALRKVVVKDENVKLNDVWTASIKDGEISYASLASAMQTLKKKGFEGIKKGSPEYKQKMQALESMQDLGIRFANLVGEQKLVYDTTEQFQLGMIVNKIKNENWQTGPLIERLLNTEPGNAGANVNAVLKMFEEAPRRADRAMFQSIKKADADKFLPEYVDEINKISVEDIPLTGADRAQDAAEKVIVSQADEGGELAQAQSRTLQRADETAAIARQEGMNKEVTAKAFKGALTNELLARISNNTSTKEFAKQIRKYASSGSIEASGDRGDDVLTTLLGKTQRGKLLDIADAIENITISSEKFGGDEAAAKAIDSLFDKTFMESNEALADVVSKGGSVKKIDSILDNFSTEIERLKNLKNNEFVKDIRFKEYNVNDTVDINNLAKVLFDPKQFKKSELTAIMKNLSEPNKQALRESYLKQQISKSLGVLPDADTTLSQVDGEESITRIAEIFNTDFLNTLIKDKERFKVIFGNDTTSGIEQVARLGKRIQKQANTGDFGKLAAAAIGIAIAGIPAGVLSGSMGVGIATGLALKYKVVNGYARLLNNPKFLEILAEPRFLTPGANTTSDSIAINLNRISEAAMQALTETDDVVEQQAQSNRNRINDKSEGSSFFDRAIAPITSLNPIMPSLNPLKATGKLIESVPPKKQSYTPLPNVQDFRQTEDIFSEINRRRALSGNNPNTQALADRNR
tara:strand:+ start:2543 stop:6529 length:3987 start_codon:yes stop_codon:yes gene_type:complete